MEVRQGDLLAGGDGTDGVHGLVAEGSIPGVLRVGHAAVVEARDVGEDGAHVRARAQGVAVGADDVAEGVLLAAMVIVQREEGALRVLWQRPQCACEVLLGRLDGLDHSRGDQGRVA